MQQLPRVMVGGPVRDREWSVPLWLGGILGTAYPRELLSLVILVNDCLDETLRACCWWADRARSEGFRRAVVVQRDLGQFVDNNARAGNRDYAAFAKLRDAWVDLRDDEDWLYQVDSDIQVPHYLLEPLVRIADRDGWDLLAGVIENNWAPAPQHGTNVMVYDSDGGAHHSLHAYTARIAETQAELTGRPAAVTGAVCVLRASVFDEGLRYFDETAEVHQAEDNVFCYRMLQRGKKVGYVPGLRATHWHRPPAETDYLRDPAWWERQQAYARYQAEILRRSAISEVA